MLVHEVVLLVQPVGGGSGQPLAVQPTVALLDTLSNLCIQTTRHVTVTIASGSGTLTGTTTLVPSRGIVQFTDLAITGSGTFVLHFSAGSGVLATQSMAFIASDVTAIVAAPATGSLTLTGLRPSIRNPHTIPVGAGALTVTGFRPEIRAPKVVPIATGALTLAGFAPTASLTARQLIKPGVGSVVATGQAPTIVRSGNKIVSAGAGNMVVIGFGPTVVRTGAVNWSEVGDPGGLTALLPVPGSSPVYDDYQYPHANLANATDNNQHYAVGSSGVYSVYNGGAGIHNGHILITDSTAPVPGTCMQWTHGNGGGAGSPGNLDTGFPDKSELFSGMIVKFDAGYPSFNAHKIIENISDAGWWFFHLGGNRPSVVGTSESWLSQFNNATISAGDANSGSGTSNISLTTGDWWKVGLYVKHQSGAGNNGILKQMVAHWNGSSWDTPVLTINRTDVQWGGTAFGEWQEYHGDSADNLTGQDWHRYTNVITLKGKA